MYQGKGLKSKDIVKKIKQGLIREKIYRKGTVEQPKSRRKSKLEYIKLRLDFFLLTAREFHNPEYLLPKNPFKRTVKKLILYFLRVFTKSQIVFNQNVLDSLEELYKYLRTLEKN